MARHTFKDYTHSSSEPDEVVEHLTDRGIPEEVARKFERGHDPLYEVEFGFTYDDESDTVTVDYVQMLHVEGKPKLVPAPAEAS
jgi:hypothetical protein